MLNYKRYYIWFTFLVLLTILLFIVDVFVGSVYIPIEKVFSILTGHEESKSWDFIILNYRLPKAITALLTGSVLAISGLMMQTLFKNPLAGPYVLGISSGASLGVALFIMAGALLPGFVFLEHFGPWGFVISAIAGAFLIMGIVMMVSTRVTDAVSLLIVGIMFGSITSAVVSVLQYFSDPKQVHNFLMWTFGSLSSTTWTELKVIAVVILPALFLSFSMMKSLNAFLLGENYARALGVNVQKARFKIIIATCLLAGTLTAFTGPIAFVGMAVPHLAKFMIRTSDHRLLMPLVAFSGACLMMICDIISQLPGYQETLPINSVTAIFGAPIVIWVIFRSRNVKVKF